MNDVPVGETGHNLNARSPQEQKRLRSKNPYLQNCALQLEVIKNNTKQKISTGSDFTEIRRF